MQYLRMALQVMVALGLLNVWLIRYNRRTAYRGGDASSMREEFAAYGLPAWAMYVVGALKVGAAVCLIFALWVPALALPAALVVCVLMLGALLMHLKIKDPLTKSLPALAILVLCVGICWISRSA